MNVYYPAKITHEKEDSSYLVEFIDFPEAITEGKSFDEAFFNASEVLTLTIEGRIEEEIDIPKPSKQENDWEMIAPSVCAQSALLVRWLKAQREQTTAEIARGLNTSWPAASRFENPKHWPSLRQLEKVAGTLGQQLVISMEPLHKDEKRVSYPITALRSGTCAVTQKF